MDDNTSTDLRKFFATPSMKQVARESNSTSALEAENDNDTELIDRLRSTALGSSRDAKSRRSAQLAFDPDVDLEKRMRHIAGLTDAEKNGGRGGGRKSSSLGWLPIPLGILAVVSLGAAMSRSGNQNSQKRAESPAAAPSAEARSLLEEEKPAPASGNSTASSHGAAHSPSHPTLERGTKEIAP